MQKTCSWTRTIFVTTWAFGSNTFLKLLVCCICLMKDIRSTALSQTCMQVACKPQNVFGEIVFSWTLKLCSNTNFFCLQFTKFGAKHFLILMFCCKDITANFLYLVNLDPQIWHWWGLGTLDWRVRRRTLMYWPPGGWKQHNICQELCRRFSRVKGARTH